MDVLSPATRLETGARHRDEPVETELSKLRQQVAWLQAERAALWWAVSHDELTGLANRRLFFMLAPSILRSSRAAIVVVLDLNGFKPINDTYGHEIGDRVLQAVAQRLAACVGQDLVARFGGDEFTAVLTSPHENASAQWWRPAVAALGAAIAEPIEVGTERLSVTASIGIANAQPDKSIVELLHRADLAMYHAKTSGSAYAAWGRQCLVDGDPGSRDRQAALGRRYAPPEALGRRYAPPEAQRVVELALFPSVPVDEAVPTCEPYGREPSSVAPAASYQRNDPVWVYRNGAWRPGVIEGASDRAVMATYRYAAGAGTVVDTMAAEYVMVRTTVDAQLDAMVAEALPINGAAA